MAKKKVLVMTNGQIEQLQAGDYVNEVNTISGTNNNAGTLLAGTPIYQTTTANKFDSARANAQGTVPVDGFLITDVPTATAGDFQDSGVLSLTTAQWDAITGQTGGLSIGVIYFLDAAAAGKMTTTAPSTAGQFVQKLGKAISTTDFHIELAQVIKL